MTQVLDTAKTILLNPTELTEQQLQNILGGMLGSSIDAADLFFQQRYHESWALEDSQVKQGAYSHDRGVGVRAIAGEKSGFAYSEELYEKRGAGALQAIQDGRYKLIRNMTIDKVELYNLSKDSIEQNNIIKNNSKEKVVKDFREQLDKFLTSMTINDGISEDDEVVIKERLKALGYIE